ncbi:MAG: hypothetical protein D6814_12830, partial [Calditrichaeota bacterium]
FHHLADEHEPIREARNYYCQSKFPEQIRKRSIAADDPSARIMLCFHASTARPGKFACAINALLLRALSGRQEGYPTGQEAYEWLLNIQYMNDMPCHNRRFNINRIFGYWEKVARDYRDPDKGLPFDLENFISIQLIEILPLGEADKRRKWLLYARHLVDFLNAEPGHPGYRLLWYDEASMQANEVHASIEDTSEAQPVAIIIHREMPPEMIMKETPEELGDYEPCRICGMQGRVYSCQNWRPWIQEQEFSLDHR